MGLRSWLDWRVVGGALALGVLALAVGVSVVSANEQNDQFCGSCHTQPETLYLDRFAGAMNAAAQDLAAYHHKQLYPRGSAGARNIRCIDCHVGEGLLGRGTVISLAAWDAVKYVTGTAQQPAMVVFTIQNEGCLKCHESQVKQNLDKPARPFIIENHFHYQLFEPGAAFERCVDCHPSHVQGSEANRFLFQRIYIPVCEDCHRTEGKGPTKM